MITPLLSSPSKNDKYFIRKAYGGYSPCKAGKPQWFTGSALCNCVGLAYGLAMKREGNLRSTIGVPPSRIGKANNPTSAHLWIKYANGRKITMTPVLYGIIVYKHLTTANLGHVMSIEAINKDHVIAVASGYGKNGYVFKTVKLPLNLSYKGWKLLGVINLNIPKPTPTPTPTTDFKVGDKVEIVAKGNSNKYGTGKTSYGIGYKRYILSYTPNTAYPYQVGSSKGVTTGYYTSQALKKI